jgi:pantoate--beta-alanine ligase
MTERIESIAELRKKLARVKAGGQTIGFVPTMGALHKGHLSLVRLAKKEADFVVVSIFVNPIQFGPKEDYQRYPRNLDKDIALLQELKTDLVFAPSENEMYQTGFTTHINMEGPALGMCGKTRPGHFSGVATVVAKLFNIVQPKIAVFGQKDLQQIAVLKRMVIDLNFDTEIIMAPIIRESDGLAMSSRNEYLTPPERKKALALNRALFIAESAWLEGERDVTKLLNAAAGVLAETPDVHVEYLVAVNPETMQELTGKHEHIAIAIAARVGSTRLIDNLIMG